MGHFHQMTAAAPLTPTTPLEHLPGSPHSPTMKGIPVYSLVVKVFSGVFQFRVFHREVMVGRACWDGDTLNNQPQIHLVVGI